MLSRSVAFCNQRYLERSMRCTPGGARTGLEKRYAVEQIYPAGAVREACKTADLDPRVLRGASHGTCTALIA